MSHQGQHHGACLTSALVTKTGFRRYHVKPSMRGEERGGAEDSHNHGHGFVLRLTKTDQDPKAASLYRLPYPCSDSGGLHERGGAEPCLESFVSVLFFTKAEPSPTNPLDHEVWPSGIVASKHSNHVSQSTQSATKSSSAMDCCSKWIEKKSGRVCICGDW
ncbi:hypothetical protein BKA66DRAFT_442809 [Pyrenochaeta sp. MPI-SDFR-AT-0127]|nr:hypothetical protein BKA66DRAFT_442809 [Pyrenochaeta sp. MPI-SDFR-AT-0127]